MALKVLESPDRLPTPQFRQGEIYNTWQDAQHVQGILRRTSLEDYLTAQPNWHTVLDYDALGKQDNQKWVEEGLVCLYPETGIAWLGSPREAKTLKACVSLISRQRSS